LKRYFGVDGIETLKARGTTRKQFYFEGLDNRTGERFIFRIFTNSEAQAIKLAAKRAAELLKQKVFFEDFEIREEKKEKIPSH
jgi:hypothetical protein